MGVLKISEDGATFVEILEDITDTLPIVDSTAVVKGSSDATKLLKFEVDGNSTGVTGTLATGFTTTKTVTIPDATDTLVGKATTDTLTNKTLTLPTIGDFTNATHLHTTAATGGQITDAALSAAVGIAKGGSGKTTAQEAIDILSDVVGATNEHVLTKDTATGNAIYKVAAGGSSLPVDDGTAIVKGSVDATKLVRIEADGVATSTTRVITMPDQNIDLTPGTGSFATEAEGNLAATAIQSGDAEHDLFSDFVANEHIDWTSATSNFSTTLQITAGGAINANGGVINSSTGAISFGNENLTTTGTFKSLTLEATEPTTAPLIVTSTAKVTNLNVDRLDDAHVGTTGAAIPLLNAINTWSAVQSFNNTDIKFNNLSTIFMGNGDEFEFKYNGGPDMLIASGGLDSLLIHKGGSLSVITEAGLSDTEIVTQLHTSGSGRTMWVGLEVNNTTTNSGFHMGLNAFAYHTGSANLTRTGNVGSLTGGSYGARVASNSVTISKAISVYGQTRIENTNTSTITQAMNFYSDAIDAEDGTITDAYGFYALNHIVHTGTLTNAYGIWLEKQTGAATVNAAIVLGGDGVGADILFGASQDASIHWSLSGDDHLLLDPQHLAAGHYVILNCPKTTTGDPTGVEGLIYWNTIDNKIKMFADGAWREMATWA